MLKHYVRFVGKRGKLTIIEIPKRDEKFAIEYAKTHKDITLYSFCDRNEFVAEDGELLCGEKKNISNWVRVRKSRFRVNSGEAGCIGCILPGHLIPKNLYD